MRDTPERDLAVAEELGHMANARIAELERERDALKLALAAYVKFSDEAAKLLDADLDHKCLKLLLAMSGHAPRYRHDVDEARAALEETK
jgi:Leu/Phe-tRNA-protein transferase